MAQARLGTGSDIKGHDDRMYVIEKSVKTDPVRRWSLPDRVFFAAGACHILAYAFIERYPEAGFSPRWIKPAKDYGGNHIVAAQGNRAFDYHGYSDWRALLNHTMRKAGRRWPGWSYEIIDLPVDALISEWRSRQYDGLWLREPKQYLHDALRRARRFLNRFPEPCVVQAPARPAPPKPRSQEIP